MKNLQNLFSKYTMLVAGVAIFSACASNSPQYVAAERIGEVGYTENKLSDDRYRIIYTGDHLTPMDLVQDYALLRAAELTVQQNHDRFEVVDRDTAPTMLPNPGGRAEFTTLYNAPNTTRCGLLGCERTQVPSFSERDVDFPDRRDQYRTSLEIVFTDGSTEENRSVYDARDVIAAVGSRF